MTMTNRLKVYGSPTCAPCRAVKARLNREDIPYEYIDVQENPEAASLLKEQGFTATPVFSYAGRLWDLTGLPGIIDAELGARAA